MKIFVNNSELRNYPITQAEDGVYHRELKYGGILQHPLDFGNMQVGFKITLNVDCRVIYRQSINGNYVTVVAGEYKVFFVHTYKHAAVGTTVKAGNPICEIAPTSANGGYAVHLHVGAQKNNAEFWIRNLIFDPSGDRFYEIIKVQRPDVIRNWTGNVHQWWTKHGYGEMMAKLKEIGRTDVIDAVNVGMDLKEWYISYGSKEYGNIWNTSPKPPEKPSVSPSSSPSVSPSPSPSVSPSQSCDEELENCEEQRRKYQALYQKCLDEKGCNTADCTVSELLHAVIDRLFGGKLSAKDDDTESV